MPPARPLRGPRRRCPPQPATNDDRRSPQACEPLDRGQSEEKSTEIHMAEDGGGGADRISGLPDNILHSILLRLPSTAEAARTSILAKGWCSLWAHLPELSFGWGCRVLDALDACLAPTVNRLVVNMSGRYASVPADIVSSWLQFASLRLAGELRIRHGMFRLGPEGRDVVLPVCERAATIILELGGYTLRFAPHPSGVFSALEMLTIALACVDGRGLESILANHCPRLKQLVLDSITQLDGTRALSIHSDSLQRLEIYIIPFTNSVLHPATVEIVAPELQSFYPHFLPQFDIPASPKLSDVNWSHSHVYNPLRHSFGVAGRHIQRLVLVTDISVVPLMQRFDTIKELVLTIQVRQGAQEYKRFLQDTNSVTKCEVLVLKFFVTEHAFKPIILHFLKRCVGIRKLVLELRSKMVDYPCKSVSNCPCGWIENRKTNNIVFDAHALEEVEVKGHDAADEVVRQSTRYASPNRSVFSSVMAEDRRHSPGEDRISGLPDELLHDILVDLGSVQAAARTSVLSRRWRHVWTRIPKLILFGCDKPPAASFQTLVDAALAAHSAPAVELFRIDIPSDGPRVPACRVAQWIRGVSQRVVGSLLVNVPWPMSRRPRLVVDDEEDLEIPACGGATRIFLKLDQRWRLRLSTAGLFAALNKLTIESARVEGSDLTALVSTQCPRLKSLNLDIVILCTVSDVSMCTDSLEVLYFNVANTRRLDVVALRLEQLNVYQALIEAHISAPNLAKLNWGGGESGGVYDPRRHKFADVGRCLRLLNINETSTGASLLQRFDTVDELKLSILIEQEIFGYHSFFNETKRLPR
ncbi:hypothetical protein EJB05_12146, partial [Eragrostis curvula]